MHLQGEALDKFREVIMQNIKILKGKDVFFCVNETPWQYYFEDENYIPIGSQDLTEELKHKKFIKVSRKLSVTDHEKLVPFCLETYNLFIKVIS
jgi:23S rRNA G2445 N2-methylase RlmL